MKEEDEDSVEYDVFYNSKDIHEALVKQNDDKFFELVTEKKKINKEMENKSLNRFNIMDWAPIEKTEETSKPKSMKKGKSTFYQQSEQENEEDESAKIVALTKKPEENAEEIKQRQTK